MVGGKASLWTRGALSLGVANSDTALTDALVMWWTTFLMVLHLVPGNVPCWPDHPSWLGWFTYSFLERKDGIAKSEEHKAIKKALPPSTMLH